MDIDFDEWFDNLKINPKYIIKTNLDIIDNDIGLKEKEHKPSKLFQLLKRPCNYKLKKRTRNIINSINLSFSIAKS